MSGVSVDEAIKGLHNKLNSQGPKKTLEKSDSISKEDFDNRMRQFSSLEVASSSSTSPAALTLAQLHQDYKEVIILEETRDPERLSVGKQGEASVPRKIQEFQAPNELGGKNAYEATEASSPVAFTLNGYEDSRCKEEALVRIEGSRVVMNSPGMFLT